MINIMMFLRYLLILTVFTAGWIRSAKADTFYPTKLHIEAPTIASYDYDGTDLHISFIVRGTDATLILLIFTEDFGRRVRNIRNGYLGWHYVHKVDTCIYVSPPQRYKTGRNTITWDGNDADGTGRPSGEHTFYLWAYNHTGEKQTVSHHVRANPGGGLIVTHDEQNMPLDSPVFYNAANMYHSGRDPVPVIRQKWIIGSDPDDASLIETTIYSGWTDRSVPALDPVDHDYFFTTMHLPDGKQVVNKYLWTPNGEAELNKDWGKYGEFKIDSWFPPEQYYTAGLVNDSNYLYLFNMNMHDGENKTELVYINIEEGNEVVRADISEWWIDEGDSDGDGDIFAGPTTTEMRNGYIALGSHLSCLHQMIKQKALFNNEEIFIYASGNGDYEGDKNFEEISDRPWLCIDSGVGPHCYSLGIDVNMFVVFSLSGTGSMSFGLLAPDGTGIGHFPLEWDNGDDIHSIKIVDYGSAYDGIYVSNLSADNHDTELRYVAHDSFKGVISSMIDYFVPFHFTVYPYKTEDNAKLIIKAAPDEFNEITFGHPDEIGVFTQKGICVGFGKVYTGQIEITVWGDDPLTEGIDGMLEGESFSFRMWDYETNTEYEAVASGAIAYSKNAVIYIDSLAVRSVTFIETKNELKTFSLSDNYPNPFNPVTTISFTLPHISDVQLSIYNTLGEKVSMLTKGVFPAGTHLVDWDARGYSSGIYFYRIEAGGFVETKKLLLLK